MDQKNQTNGSKTLITLTPTWAYMAQVMTEALVNGTAEGSTRAREEIVSMGERLDELKRYTEKKDKEVDDLFDDLDEARESGSRAEKNLEEASKEIEKRDELIAIQRQQIERLEEYRAEQIRYWDERNVLQPGLPGIKHEDPIHDKILDLILESEVGKRNKLTDEAMDLVGVRELMVYTLNQNAKHREENAELEEVGE